MNRKQRRAVRHTGTAVASPRTASRPAFEHLHAYLCAHEIFGRPVSSAEILAYARDLDLVQTFEMLAAVAGTLANDGGLESQRARSATIGALRAPWVGADPRVPRVALWCAAHPERVVAHERVIYWLQALVLAECRSGGRTPTLGDVAWLMLTANDHLDAASSADDGGGLDALDTLLASTARESRFNVGGDELAAMMRGYQITATPPESGPLASSTAWDALHRKAFFDMAFHDYFVRVLLPLALQSTMWGVGLESPMLGPDFWSRNTRADLRAGEALFEKLSISEEDAREGARKERGADGLPRTPSIFAHTPLLRLADGRFIAVSPWRVRAQLRLGLWDACRRAACALHNEHVWTPAFGQSFELWARAVARRVAESARFKGTLNLSLKLGGADELEDIVIIDNSRVALVSAKARLLPHAVAQETAGRASVVGWYRSVFLDPAMNGHRAGALRLLESRVQRIRAGLVPNVDPASRIYPVVLTYEQLGDGPVLYTWVRKRCEEAEVLQQPDVAPVTFLSAQDYEWLMAAAAEGTSVFDVLDYRTSTDAGLMSLDVALPRFRAGSSKPLRVPGMEEASEALVNESRDFLFRGVVRGVGR